MSERMVYITPQVKFSDLSAGRIEKIDLVRDQFQSWLFEPAKVLAERRRVEKPRSKPNETDFYGMALFALLLMFFEPHGQYLKGAGSQGKSKKTFSEAFRRFTKHLSAQNKLRQDDPELTAEMFYQFARCNLFHSFKLANNLLVDTYRVDSPAIAKNPYMGGWLVNPWQMRVELEDYFHAYINGIKTNNDPELTKNFNIAFEQLIAEPMQHYSEG